MSPMSETQNSVSPGQPEKATSVGGGLPHTKLPFLHSFPLFSTPMSCWDQLFWVPCGFPELPVMVPQCPLCVLGLPFRHSWSIKRPFLFCTLLGDKWMSWVLPGHICEVVYLYICRCHVTLAVEIVVKEYAMWGKEVRAAEWGKVNALTVLLQGEHSGSSVREDWDSCRLEETQSVNRWGGEVRIRSGFVMG